MEALIWLNDFLWWFKEDLKSWQLEEFRQITIINQQKMKEDQKR
jgi:hypothetical protein